MVNKTLLISALGLAAMLPSAFGDMLSPGGSGAPDTFVAGTLGALVTTTGPQQATVTLGTETLTIDYIESVYMDTGTSGGILGDMDFVITATNDNTNPPISNDVLENITLGSFVGFTTDAGIISGSGVDPSLVSLTSDGKTVGFSFASNALTPGESTDELVVRTNATTTVDGALSFQDTLAVSALGYGPASLSGTPEPATMVLLGSALLGLGFMRKRVRK